MGITLALVSSKLFISQCSFHYDSQEHFGESVTSKVARIRGEVRNRIQVKLAHKDTLSTIIKVKVEIRLRTPYGQV